MKSLANDIRICQGKVQQNLQDHKVSNFQSSKKLQELIESNIQCEAAIKVLQKQAQKLEAANILLDQQLKAKKQQLENTRKQLEDQEEKQQNEGQQEMNQWITHVQNYSGVPQEVIDSLISLQYEVSGDDQQICLSCYQPMLVGVQCKYLPCYHLFHSQCIINHLKVNKLCPACGEPVSH